MSGRIAYLESGKQAVCDMATGRRTLAEDLNSFWSQHAHRNIEIEWVNHDDPGREFSTYAQTGSHSFLEYHA